MRVQSRNMVLICYNLYMNTEERKAMPKNAQTTAQLHSSHTLVN